MGKPNIEDAFGDISDAKARVNSTYMGPGRYLMVVRKIKFDKSRKKKNFMVLEGTVLKVLKGGSQDPVHKVGEAVSHMIMEEWEGFLSDCSAMFAVLTGRKPTEITSKVCKKIFGESQPLAGMVFECHNRNKVTKKGNDFTNVDYKRRLSPEEVSEEIKAKVLEAEGVPGYASKGGEGKKKKGKKKDKPEPEPTPEPVAEKPKKKKDKKKKKKDKSKDDLPF